MIVRTIARFVDVHVIIDQSGHDHVISSVDNMCIAELSSK